MSRDHIDDPSEASAFALRSIADSLELVVERLGAILVAVDTRPSTSNHGYDVPIGYWCCAMDWRLGTFRSGDCILPTSGPAPVWERVP
jgi:hypothetical protein